MIHPFRTYITAAVASRLSINEILNVLQTDTEKGIHPSVASSRLLQYGHNELLDKNVQSVWIAYLLQFRQPMIVLLLISALISLIFHQFDDAISITLAVIIVVTVGFIQEYRSEEALKALNKLLPQQSKCIRHGQPIHIPSNLLVPGDLVLLEVGDRIPADIRIVNASEELLVDESSFTGENECILKSVKESGRESILFAGSTIKYGCCKGLVLATGEYSEFGAILKLMRDEVRPDSPLQKSMDHLSKQISLVSLVVITIIVFIGFMLGGYAFREILSIGVSLAVAAIPEGLPIVVTVTLALGVLRMAKKNTIIRHIQSLETMGRIDVICFDKTGTLTHNQMTVNGITSFQDNQVFEWTLNDTPHPSIIDVVRAGLLCNNAELVKTNDTWEMRGQPTEGAIWVAAQKHFDMLLLKEISNWTRLQEWPFSSEKRFMAVKVKDTNERIRFIMKGAFETVIEHCTNRNIQLRSTGHRTLAIAEGDSFESLKIIGLISMFDPVRQSALQTFNHLRYLYNICPVIITGDAEEATAHIECIEYVADQVGLDLSSKRLSGDQAEKELSHAQIYYRTSPKQKLAIIRSLQRRNKVVAMVGDGVNDSIALRAADVGVSVGSCTTTEDIKDVNREAADIILLKDDLNLLISLVEEGRCIFQNINNFIRFQLSTSISALCLIAVGTFMRYSPLNAMQILWINIIMDGPPAQSLGVEPADKQLIKIRNEKNVIIDKHFLFDVLFRALIIVLGTLSVFVSNHDYSKQRRTTLTFTCFVLFDMFNALTCRSKERPIFQLGFTSNRSFCFALLFSLIGQMLVIYWRPFQYIFQTEALSFYDMFYLILLCSSVFWISESIKYFNLKNLTFKNFKKEIV